MNQSILNRYVLIPSYILAVITAIRTPLQINAPEHAMTQLFSSVALMFVLIAVYPMLLQRRGLSFMEFLKVLWLMILLVRIPVAAAYGLAFAFQWTDPSGEPVRYIQDFKDFPFEVGTMMSIFIAIFMPLLIGTILGALIWSITWACAYRGDRSWSGTALQK